MRAFSNFSVKTVFNLLFVGILFTACNQQHKEAKDSEAALDKTHAHHSGQENWQRQIHTDEGKQWQANDATTLGILNMTHLIQVSSAKTISDYHDLGTALDNEKNLLIEKCTMKGASHDNLHIYLEPLLTKIAALKSTTSTEEGKRIMAGILQHLKLYHNYFA